MPRRKDVPATHTFLQCVRPGISLTASCHALSEFVVLNGNYALEAGYNVVNDSIAYEKADSEAAKTYVNIIAVKEGNENNEGIVALVEALKSDEIKEFINNTYNGGVIPFE